MPNTRQLKEVTIVCSSDELSLTKKLNEILRALDAHNFLEVSSPFVAPSREIYVTVSRYTYRYVGD